MTEQVLDSAHVGWVSDRPKCCCGPPEMMEAYWEAQRLAKTPSQCIAQNMSIHRSTAAEGSDPGNGTGLVHHRIVEGARDRALECRKLREQEIDPIEAREAARRRAAMARAKALVS